jgi:hypothetical protein
MSREAMTHLIGTISVMVIGAGFALIPGNLALRTLLAFITAFAVERLIARHRRP